MMDIKKYIETRDRRVQKAYGIDQLFKNEISNLWDKLLTFKEVEVGGRASCGGGKVDPSWVVFTSWDEVIKKANSSGFNIEVIPVKHGNAYAGVNGGFWHSNIYKLSIGGE